MFKIFFLLKCRVRLKEVLWGVLWGISPSKGVLWGRAMAAVQRSIECHLRFATPAHNATPRLGAPP